MKYKSVTYYNKNGKRHCLDGPAVIRANGYKEWWVNGKPHREDGPAYINADGYKVWYQNGERHRLDGPAVIRADGSKTWWVNSDHYGEGKEAPEKYLYELEKLGVTFVRGSD